jgi:hypothetical protein
MQVRDMKDNKELTRAELQQKLRAKLNGQRDTRRSKLNRRLRQESTPVSKMHQNQNLLAQVELMTEAMERPAIKAQPNQVKKAMALKNEFEFLNKNYPQIFMAIVRGEMNLDIFKMMLNARHAIKSGDVSQDEADKKIGTFLFNRYKK